MPSWPMPAWYMVVLVTLTYSVAVTDRISLGLATLGLLLIFFSPPAITVNGVPHPL